MCLDRAVRVGESFPRVRGKVVWKAVQRLAGSYGVRGGASLFGTRKLKLGETQVPDDPSGTIRLGHSRRNKPEASSTYPAGLHVTARRADAVAYGAWNWGHRLLPSRPDIRVIRGVLLGKVLFRGIQEGIPVLIVDKVIWVEDVGPVFKDGEGA